MNISIVIPLYNEEKYIGGVVNSLKGYKLPVIVVNDGSNDNSQSVIDNLKLSNVTLIKHKVNLGKGAAMKTGADYSFSHGADAVIFMDSDGQHEANDLAKFIEALKSKKYDVVFGSRNSSYGVPLVRYLGNKCGSVLMGFLFGVYISDVICGFRAISKKAYSKLSWESRGYGVEVEMVARLGKSKLSFCEIPIQTIYHEKLKGVTILDAFGILGEVVKWRITI